MQNLIADNSKKLVQLQTVPLTLAWKPLIAKKQIISYLSSTLLSFSYSSALSNFPAYM